MTLTATQRAVLDAALARPDRSLLPTPDRISGGAAKKVVAALVKRGLAEVRADGTPVATEAAAAPEGAQEAQERPAANDGPAEDAPAHGAAQAADAARPKVRAGTKQARLIEMLRRDGGATVDEIMAETGWAAHTVRGAISGALKKRLGLDVRSESVEGRGRAYRIVD